MRSHGWDRGLKNIKKKNNFNFINSGFNLRPMDLTAAIGLSQLKRLNKMIKSRSQNRKLIINKIKSSKFWDSQFTFFNPSKNLEPSWFGLPILLDTKYIKKKEKFLNFLNKNKVETRPIISGNFVNQPAIKLYNISYNLKELQNSKQIDKRGFFIGLPTTKLSDIVVKKLAELLLKVSKI